MQSHMYVYKYSLFQAVIIISALVPVAILIYPPAGSLAPTS